MKRILLFVIIFIMLFSLCAYGEREVTVMVDGSVLTSDVPPMLKDGRTYLPLRAILNALGVENENITYWEISRSVEVRHNGTHIFMVLDSTEAIVNDKLYYLDAPPFETEGRTLVPVRFLSENLNCRVYWDEESYTVNIYNDLKPAD